MQKPTFPEMRDCKLGSYIAHRIHNTRGTIKATHESNNYIKEGISENLRARLLRDVCDRFIRECAYSLGIHKGTASSCKGALYYEKDMWNLIYNEEENVYIERKEKWIKRATIEHVVSVGCVRNNYFYGMSPYLKSEIKDIDFVEALLCPVSLINKSSEKKLKPKNIDWPEKPFERYIDTGINIVTFDGRQDVKFDTWSWEDHWCLVKKVDELKILYEMFCNS